MTEKTIEKATVTVTAPDGQSKTFSSDTIILFTVDKSIKTLNGKKIDANSVYVGSDIPKEIFGEVIGTLVGCFIKRRGENIGQKPAYTAYDLDYVSRLLMKQSEEIMGGYTREELEAELDEALEDLKKLIFE